MAGPVSNAHCGHVVSKRDSSRRWRSLRHAADRGAVAADLARPGLTSFVHGERSDAKADDRVKPPPAKQSVGGDAHQDAGGRSRAEPGLSSVARRCCGVELRGDLVLRSGQQRHNDDRAK